VIDETNQYTKQTDSIESYSSTEFDDFFSFFMTFHFPG
jgi:hypothetical protein